MAPVSFKVKIKEVVTDTTSEPEEIIFGLKSKVEGSIGVEAAFQKWIYKGRVLADDATFESTGILDGDMVIAMKANAASTYSATLEGAGDAESREASAREGSTSAAPATTATIDGATQQPVRSMPWQNQAFDMAMHMLLNNEEEKVRAAVSLLLKITNNIVANPMEEKYRKMKGTSATFTSKLGSLPGGTNIMQALGFTLISEEWVLTPSEQAWNNLVACQAKLQAFSTKLTSHNTSGTSPPTTGAVTGSSSSSASVNQDNVLLMAMLQQMAMNSGGSGDSGSSNSNSGGSEANNGDGGSGQPSSGGDSNNKA